MQKHDWRHLAVQTYVKGFTLWHYNALQAGQTLDAVVAPHFFDGSGDLVNPGDRVMVSALDGCADLYAIEDGFLIVSMARSKISHSAPCVAGGMADAVIAVEDVL